MTGNNKLFKTYYKGQEVYAHAATVTQAAFAMARKLDIPYVNPEWVREVKPLTVFKCWYTSFYKTQYVYIVAKSPLQAWFYYCSNDYVRMRDHMSKDQVLNAEHRAAPLKADVGSIYGEDSDIAW